MEQPITVDAVLTGRARPFGPNGEPSGMDKREREGAVRISPKGVADDEQGDKLHHGGPDKAVHHYARDHYPFWREQCPGAAERLAAPGAFGENISTTGLTERDVCVGDVLRLGTAVVEVCQARQPCWRLNVRFNRPDMARQVQDSHRSGWYYRVLEPGWLAAGDSLTLLERPCPDWPLARTLDVIYNDPLNEAVLTEMLELPALAEAWRGLLRRRLERGAVEDWSGRLTTPQP